MELRVWNEMLGIFVGGSGHTYCGCVPGAGDNGQKSGEIKNSPVQSPTSKSSRTQRPRRGCSQSAGHEFVSVWGELS